MDPTSGEMDQGSEGHQPEHAPDDVVTRLDALREALEALEAALAAGRQATHRRG